MGRLWKIFAPVLSVVLLTGACAGRDGGGGAAGDGEKPRVTIAFMGALSGPNASLEIGPRNAASLVFEQANAKGDLPVEIAFQPEDTQGDEEAARTIAQKLRTQEDLVGVIGPGFSGESKSAGEILEDLRLPRITPSATATSLGQRGWEYWFRGVASDAAQGGQAPAVITKYVKGTKVYIAHDKTEYGQGLATIVRDALPADLVVGFEGVDPKKDDYSGLVNKVVAQGADVFYWGGYEPEAMHIVRQLRQRGYQGTFLGADGAKGSNILGVKEAAGALLTCPCIEPTTSSDDDAKTFVTDYQAKFNQPPSVYAAEGHDVALVFVEAIRRAGAPGDDLGAYRQELTDAIRALSVDGVAGTADFQDNGELAGNPPVLLYRIKDGAYEPLGLVTEIAK